MDAQSIIAKLQAMDNPALNKLAAEKVMGWVLTRTREPGVGAWWADRGGESRVVASRTNEWLPTTDRNQSGQCLERQIEHGARFLLVLGEQPIPAELANTPRVEGVSARGETITAIACVLMRENKL